MISYNFYLAIVFLFYNTMSSLEHTFNFLPFKIDHWKFKFNKMVRWHPAQGSNTESGPTRGETGSPWWVWVRSWGSDSNLPLQLASVPAFGTSPQTCTSCLPIPYFPVRMELWLPPWTALKPCSLASSGRLELANQERTGPESNPPPPFWRVSRLALTQVPQPTKFKLM